VTLPQWVKLERTGSGNFIAKHGINNTSWQDVNAPDASPVSPLVPMGITDPNLYIGTAVTSHNALETCTADMNNFTPVPAPNPPYAYGDIGNNDAEQLYVALSDGSVTAVVEHDDVNAATFTDWQEWNVALSEFSDQGLNLSNVRKVYVGLGDRSSPVQGGSGALYIDDIRACPPRCVPSLLKSPYDIAVPYDCIVDEKDLLVFAGEWLAEKTEVRDWNRVAYWDAARPAGGWTNLAVTEAVRDYLVLNGYTVVDANELKTWMDARIADEALSVVVFCKDIVPDTVAETQDANCTIRRYLDAGGKVVWYADWPFYYQSLSDGTLAPTWGPDGAINILGFNASGGPNNTGEEVAFTPAGINWGLTTTWPSLRPTPPTITSNLTALATISGGSAAGWAKHYVEGDTYRGFVRIADFNAAATTPPVGLLADLVRVAEYKGDLITDWYQDDVINFKDYGVLANHYLDEVLWPAE
jgi:hypothetical protein